MRLLRAPLSERLGMEYGGKWLLGMLGNMIAGQLAADAGIEGAQVSSNSACASSGLSLVNGCNAIRAGQADIAVVGGSEYVTGPSTTYVSFDHMMFKRGALTRDWRKYGEAANALRAFDAVRDGFVPGDAAVLIVLMRRRVADVLGIQPLARVLGVATNTCQSDKYGKSLADGTITGQAALLARLFEKSGIDARHLPGRLVHFLHGTGTKVGGINEVYAAAHAVGDIAREGRYVATGIKERDGHTLGAAFAGNISAAIEAIRHKIVPGLPSTREVDPELRTVKSEVVGREKVEIDPRALCAVADSILCHRHAEVEPERDIVIADAKGFGGTNAAVAIRGER
jgi:3-oxoacyl-[acyl-carrier-protein] synthase II